MSYQTHLTQSQLSEQLLVGIKKHLVISQTTSYPKEKRMESLSNIAEVLEYVINNINEAIPQEEQIIYQKFFILLAKKIAIAKVQIHQKPVSFTDEIGFISTVLSLKR